ncbi:MAG: CHRD domain-containing protein [Pyrinomonadaceae bacterium]
MKRSIIFGLVLSLAIAVGLHFVDNASAQRDRGDVPAEFSKAGFAAPEGGTLLTENFPYAPGSLLTDNNWTAHSAGGTNSQATVAPGLLYPGHPGSGSGNAVAMTVSGEDVHRTFTVQTSGSVYAVVLANFSDAAIDAAGLGGYFFHLGPDPISTTFRGRLYVQKDGANQLAFGISKATSSNAADISFTPFQYDLNTTHLLIVKYTIVEGPTNDSVGLFVNPTLNAAEPAVTVSAPDIGASDINPGTVALRQGSAATAPTLTADGIIVGRSWSEIGGGGGPVAPLPGPKLFKAHLTGAQENPPVTTNATGFGRVVLNSAETEITASVYYDDLSSPTTLGHIHGPAEPGMNGPVIFDMAPTVGQTSGSAVDRVFQVSPAQVADLKAGLWYFNIHTQTNGGGEIRGQITVNTPRLDTDGDGDSDYGIIRPGAGGGAGQATWYTSLNEGTGNDPFTIQEWGLNSDLATPGDFDGDGKDDLAFWRPSGTPAFFILQSSTGTLQQVTFGLPGDDPTIVADYSGDGKDDPAIYRPGAGASDPSFFWTLPSSGPLTGVQVVQQWGIGSDFAAKGDFDGDGKHDLCVTRNVDGFNVFITLTQTGDISYTQFGLSGSTPDFVVPGDYDGDGKTDLAVSRGEGNTIAWYYRPSSGGPDVRVGWGTLSAGDIEAQGDYDGDGKTDIAVWRPSGGSSFFVAQSSGGFAFSRWGLPTDIPSILDIH